MNAPNGGVWTPAWLLPLLGQREKRINSAPDVQVLCVGQDGTRLPDCQRLIESRLEGSYTVDSQRRAIIN
jgi:hypothetical protein